MNAKKKLLFYTKQFGRSGSQGGVGVSAERIVQQLAVRFEVHVLYASKEIAPFSIIEDTSTNISTSISIFQIGRHSNTQDFRKALFDYAGRLQLKNKYHEVSAFYSDADAFPLALLTRQYNLPFKVFCRGNDLHCEIFGVESSTIKEVLSSATTCFCPASDMLPLLRAFCPETEAVFLPNSVDTELFKSTKIRESFNSPIKIGLFGDIKHKKGLSLLLEAIEFKYFSLKIVGSLRPETQKLLHGYLCLNDSSKDQFQVLDRTEHILELIEHYLDCDIVCLPSLYDGMPNVLLEALSLGCICLASDTGGARDVIEPGESGFLFEAGSSASLKASLENIRKLDSKQLINYRKAARSRVLNNFSLKIEEALLHKYFAI